MRVAACRPSAVFDVPSNAMTANEKGRNEKVSALSYVTTHAVTGRRRCLMLAPALVRTNVTPPPE
jgi:hypothetical protein